MLCAMHGAEKRQWPAETPHTSAGILVCCERALKSAGERTTHGGYRCGDLRETARAREATLRASGFGVAHHDIDGRWRRFGGGGGGSLLAAGCW
jgi:hypothetical protein